MKKKELEKKLRKLGWWLDRHGGSHDVWTNGSMSEPIPRHNEVNEFTAKKILRKAKDHPVVEDK